MKICIVGAGITGVSSAYQVKKRFPEAQIDVVADEFSPNTVSDVAAGLIGGPVVMIPGSGSNGLRRR
jgi:glycine/D-amino acid oxidase-like deaminating enzyme